jgi:hypothetical protein
MGFTQRQAGGRFTRDEAADFIERLQDAESHPGQRTEGRDWRQSAQEQLLGRMPAEPLAAELRRRGWMVIEPLSS